MFKLGVKRLRSLESVDPIEICPITVLVGRNSSGKSTFLRSLPLLRQSITTRTSAPLLWYGDWVDYGDFDGAVFGNDTSSDIAFTFAIDKFESRYEYFDNEVGYYRSVARGFQDVKLDIHIVKYGDGTRIASMRMAEGSNNVVFDIEVSEDGGVSKIAIDQTDMTRSLGKWKLNVSAGSIFPTISESHTEQLRQASHPVRAITPSFRMGTDIISQYVANSLDKRITEETLSRLIGQLGALSPVSQSNFNQLAEKTPNRSWAKLLRDAGGQDRDKKYKKLRLLILLGLFPSILDSLSIRLRDMISSTLYIGPARAKSDRYYRYQDLAVSEIDPDGKNFPMFLNSLKDTQIAAFSKWVESLFGYGIKVKKESGHITINLVYEDSTVNIVDTGYGISQILPVLGQVWWASNQVRSPRRYATLQFSPIIAIEQPELHLHPAHQALLADAFVGTLGQTKDKNSRRDTHFLIETHSETMINRLGELIFQGQITPADVQIVIFSADLEKERTTQVRVVKFDKEGQLIDWPYGFFSGRK